MKLFHYAIAVMALACLAANLVSCNTLALKGEKKYSVELSNAVTNIDEQIKGEGQVTDAAEAKLAGVLTKYQKDFGTRTSYLKAQELQQTIKDAKASSTPFNKYQEASMKILEIQDTLKLESEE